MTACSQHIKGTSPDSKSQEDKKQRVSKGAISGFHPWSKSNTFKARKRLNENQIEQGRGGGWEPDQAPQRRAGPQLGQKGPPTPPESRQMEMWRPLPTSQGYRKIN